MIPSPDGIEPMSTTALQLAHAAAPLIQDYRSLLARVNAQLPQSEECPEVEDPSVSVVEQLAAQVASEPAVVPAVPTHLTTRLTNALSCSIPTLQAVAKHLTGGTREMVEVTLQAQQELVDSCRAEAKLAEKLVMHGARVRTRPPVARRVCASTATKCRCWPGSPMASMLKVLPGHKPPCVECWRACERARASIPSCWSRWTRASWMPRSMTRTAMPAIPCSVAEARS